MNECWCVITSTFESDTINSIQHTKEKCVKSLSGLHYMPMRIAQCVLVYSFGWVFLCYFYFQFEYLYRVNQMNNVLLPNCCVSLVGCLEFVESELYCGAAAAEAAWGWHTIIAFVRSIFSTRGNTCGAFVLWITKMNATECIVCVAFALICYQIAFSLLTHFCIHALPYNTRIE